MRNISHRIAKIPFLCSEDGAVTVDWVVLTAAIVGLGIAVMVPIGSAVTDKSTGVGNAIGAVHIGYQ